MASIRGELKSIFVWSYARGTIQYDIICALILAFIFFVPRSCFVRQTDAQTRPAIQKNQTAPQQTQSQNENK